MCVRVRETTKGCKLGVYPLLFVCDGESHDVEGEGCFGCVTYSPPTLGKSVRREPLVLQCMRTAASAWTFFRTGGAPRTMCLPSSHPFSLCWTSRTRTARPTAWRHSCTRRTGESTRSGWRPSSSRAGSTSTTTTTRTPRRTPPSLLARPPPPPPPPPPAPEQRRTGRPECPGLHGLKDRGPFPLPLSAPPSPGFSLASVRDVASERGTCTYQSERPKSKGRTFAPTSCVASSDVSETGPSSAEVVVAVLRRTGYREPHLRCPVRSHLLTPPVSVNVRHKVVPSSRLGRAFVRARHESGSKS
ncbi:unnamed protein product [Ixodes pacificus]